MSKFLCAKDEYTIEYCELITSCLVSKLHILNDEAIALIDSFWGHLGIYKDDMIYHEMPDYWANAIIEFYEL